MEALDHYNKFEGGPMDLTHIIKGKRNRRQRPQSPIPFTIAATHSSSSNNTISSHATSNDFPTGSAATEEDEDTALCLILLSNGFSQHPLKVENDDFAVYKFNSKRYLHAPTTAASGKAGIYAYECKTCSRTFPSFQALGGHRASHKKPKTTIVVEQKKKPLMVLSYDEEQPPPAPPPQESIKRNSSSLSSLSLQLGNRGIFTNPDKSSKFHECSICGAEFNSGQALGGHMRRHRVFGCTTTNSANPTLFLVPSSQIKTRIEDDKKSRNDGLCLDLNLPAPDDDDHHRDSKFAFLPKQQQQQQQQKQSALVLSTVPTLVDCHY